MRVTYYTARSVGKLESVLGRRKKELVEEDVAYVLQIARMIGLCDKVPHTTTNRVLVNNMSKLDLIHELLEALLPVVDYDIAPNEKVYVTAEIEDDGFRVLHSKSQACLQSSETKERTKQELAGDKVKMLLEENGIGLGASKAIDELVSKFKAKGNGALQDTLEAFMRFKENKLQPFLAKCLSEDHHHSLMTAIDDFVTSLQKPKKLSTRLSQRLRSTIAPKKKNPVARLMTPEEQARRHKEQREHGIQQAKLARARAARYNMTVRALALKSVKKNSAERDEQIAAAREARSRAAKYQMTSRSLTLAVSKNRKTVGLALGGSADPKVAKKLVEEAAKQYSAITGKTVVAEEEDGMEERDATNGSSETSESLTEDYDDDSSFDETKMIVMKDLKAAIDSGDEDRVNRVILEDFLKDHAPDRLVEIDELLEKYQGEKLELLFEDLTKSYPDPAEHSDIDPSEKVTAKLLKRLDELETPRRSSLRRSVPRTSSDDDDSNDGFIVNAQRRSNGSTSRWAVNVDSHVLSERLRKAGAKSEDIKNIVSSSGSDMM